MKTLTFKRDQGFKSVIAYANGKGFAVSTKTYKSERGAIAANNRIIEICGANWELADLPYRTTDDEGKITVNYKRENRIAIK